MNEVEKELIELGYDPEQIAKRGERLVKTLFENQDLKDENAALRELCWEMVDAIDYLSRMANCWCSDLHIQFKGNKEHSLSCNGIQELLKKAREVLGK